MAGPGAAPILTNHGADPLVKELVLGFYGHCVATMPDVEVEKVKLAMKPVRALYGESGSRQFKPVAFKAVRSQADQIRLGDFHDPRSHGTVRRMVAWGVEHEMAPADALQRIQAVGGLRAGRDGVKPSKKIRPAPAGRYPGHLAPRQYHDPGDGGNSGIDRHAARRSVDA